jgi:hypothetical protein
VYGVEQALTIDEPVFPAIDGDALIDTAAVSYREADPDVVVTALHAAATRLARLADSSGTAAWSRGLTIGESRMDVRRLLEHALHDSQHHLQDVQHGLDAIRAQRGLKRPMTHAVSRRPRCADTRRSQ